MAAQIQVRIPNCIGSKVKYTVTASWPIWKRAYICKYSTSAFSVSAGASWVVSDWIKDHKKLTAPI